ncbi:MAG: penicillin-binding transpeptidase domain-containing protein [Gammaproteobacteria bacterium]
MDEYRRLGYRGDEKVGQSGIEKWAEDYLAGKHGGSLYVVDPNGQIVTRLGDSPPEPADSIYLTIDENLQFYAQKALTGFNGAVVVLERDTGRVLAMASSPDYNPNLFEPTNPNNTLLTELLNSGDQPLINRAAQSQYPLGSVFKIITFSAGLESGLYLPETTYDCQYEWTRLPDQIRHDWTWQHCQDAVRAGDFCDDSSTLPSGLLTLPEGLLRSCNPYFWDIGYTLFQNDRINDIAAMARVFGLGQPTGIEQVAEAPGQINDPPGAVELVNQAIGQGDVLVTPLQVAMMIAAVGNGGTLYRPQLIEKIQPIEGDPIVVFKPEARGTLPLRADNLQVLQDALWEVVHNTRGTANFRLRGLNIPVAGKTGTAESGSGLPHAWFAGYTLAADNTSLPDIAIAVIVENVGEGSDYAAPIFKAVVETYYYGQPQSIPWFGPIGGPQYTPTPFGGIPTRTPRP